MSFLPICGRCGKRFTYLDLTTVEAGRIRRHAVFCQRWLSPPPPLWESPDA